MLQARNLEGEVFDLPGAFAGDPSVVVVAFRRHQPREVDTWMAWLESVREHLPELVVYELPAIKRRWLPARGLIDGGMRAGIADLGTRQRTLTAYTDVGALTRALRIDSTSTIVLFVLAKEATVVWSERDPHDPDAAADVERAGTAVRHDDERSGGWPAT